MNHDTDTDLPECLEAYWEERAYLAERRAEAAERRRQERWNAAAVWGVVVLLAAVCLWRYWYF